MTCKFCETRGTTPKTCTYDFCAPKARGHAIQHSMNFGRADVYCLKHMLWLETCKATSEDADARRHAQWYLDAHAARCEARETLQASSYPVALAVSFWRNNEKCPVCTFGEGFIVDGHELNPCPACQVLEAWRILNPHHTPNPVDPPLPDDRPIPF